MPLKDAVLVIEERRAELQREINELELRASPLRAEYARLAASLRLLGKPIEKRYGDCPRPGTHGALVLDILLHANRPMRMSEIGVELDKPLVSLGTVLKRLVIYNVVIRVGRGLYEAVDRQPTQKGDTSETSPEGNPEETSS